jgi:hypothetical protein
LDSAHCSKRPGGNDFAVAPRHWMAGGDATDVSSVAVRPLSQWFIVANTVILSVFANLAVHCVGRASARRFKSLAG